MLSARTHPAYAESSVQAPFGNGASRPRPKSLFDSPAAGATAGPIIAGAPGPHPGTDLSRCHPGVQPGLTLLELLVALVVLGVLLAVGVPSFSAMSDKSSLRGAARAIHMDLRLARSEAFKRGRPVSLSFRRVSDTDWCYGLAEGKSGCDCLADDCRIDGIRRVRTSQDIGAGVLMQSLPAFFPGGVPRTSFDGMHGIAGNGTIRLVSQAGVEARVVVSRLGRVRVCTANSSTYGLEQCP